MVSSACNHFFFNATYYNILIIQLRREYFIILKKKSGTYLKNCRHYKFNESWWKVVATMYKRFPSFLGLLPTKRSPLLCRLFPISESFFLYYHYIFVRSFSSSIINQSCSRLSNSYLLKSKPFYKLYYIGFSIRLN